MRKFLTFSRTDRDLSVSAALQSANLIRHGTFEVPTGHDPVAALPHDPRFLYIERGVGTVFVYDTEAFAIRPFTLGLPLLLLGPEIDAALKGSRVVTLRIAAPAWEHPKRDRIAYDTYAVAYFGTPGFITFEDVKAGRPLYIEVNRKRLVKMLVRAVEKTAEHEGVTLGDLLGGITLDAREPQMLRSHKAANAARAVWFDSLPPPTRAVSPSFDYGRPAEPMRRAR